VLLRQALLANRERRGLCERLTELVEQKQVSVLHLAISAVEGTLLPSGGQGSGAAEQDALLADALAKKLSAALDAEADEDCLGSSVSETNHAGNSVDALLEQRLMVCWRCRLGALREMAPRPGTR